MWQGYGPDRPVSTTNPAADPTVAIQKYENRRAPGVGATPDYLFRPDYASGYSVVPLLHPGGQTHNVAMPIGFDMNAIAAANPEYHHDQEPLAFAETYFLAGGTIGEL